MPSIGETLREARMRQRLDIADVEQRTKIRAKYLRALENEEFGMLPGPTFVKTFLRTYAEQLGLDPHVLVEEYRANYEGEDELELQPLGPPSAVGAGPQAAGRGSGRDARAARAGGRRGRAGGHRAAQRRRRQRQRPGRARPETTDASARPRSREKEKPPPPKRVVVLRVVPATRHLRLRRPRASARRSCSRARSTRRRPSAASACG